MFNYLFAKQQGGQYILRIDDTDQERNVEAALAPILEGFRWLGLTWDEGPEVGGPHAPYFQSQRSARYQEAVEQLLASGAGYEDFATPEEMDAERKAAEAEQRFRELAELGPVVPYTFEVDHGEQLRIEHRYMGPLMSEILGLPREAWNEPARWFELMHPDDRDQVVAQTRANAEGGEPWDVDYRMIAADGRIVWLNDRGRCVERDQIGRPIRFQGVMLDVTTRRATEDALAAEHAILRDLIDGMPAIPWTHTQDPDSGWTRYVFMGAQAYELVGYTSEELVAEPYHFPRLVHPDDRERVTRANEASDRTGVWDDEYPVIHRDGSVRWIHSVGRRVTPQGWEPETWHGVTIDVTSRHAPEEPVRAPVEDQAEQQG